MEVHAAGRCSEFPNDNPGLHRGAIWRCLEIRGDAACERPVPASEARECEVERSGDFKRPEILGTPQGDAGEAGEEDDGIEVVEELAFDAVDECAQVAESWDIDEAPVGELSGEVPGWPSKLATTVTPDPFGALLGILEDVTRAGGGAAATIELVRSLLGTTRINIAGSCEPNAEALIAYGILRRGEHGLIRSEWFVRQVQGWQGVLRGESEDFHACGPATLDEWCANLLAQAMGSAARVEGLRRDLRRHGVAAFGLIARVA